MCAPFRACFRVSPRLSASLSPLARWLAGRYMDKRLFLQLNGARTVTGVLRGFDPFMNLVMDEVVDETHDKEELGMVVSVQIDRWDVDGCGRSRSGRNDANSRTCIRQVIRGNSVVMLEALERILD